MPCLLQSCMCIANDIETSIMKHGSVVFPHALLQRSLTLTADIQLDQLESACKVLDTIKAVQDFNQSNRVEDLGEVKRKHLSAMSRISEGVSKDLCKWVSKVI